MRVILIMKTYIAIKNVKSGYVPRTLYSFKFFGNNVVGKIIYWMLKAELCLIVIKLRINNLMVNLVNQIQTEQIIFLYVFIYSDNWKPVKILTEDIIFG